MDRDEALKLLRGGRDGVEEWNQRRTDDEEIPDFRDLVLGHADPSKDDPVGDMIQGARFVGPNLQGADLKRVNLAETHLGEANLQRANLRGANLGYANLVKADISGADLSTAILPSINLCGTNLSHAKLRGAYLSNANLREANLSNADLLGAILSDANLTDANLEQASLVNASLRHANLFNTKLVGADLTDCEIFGVNVWKTQVQDANQKNMIVSDHDEPEITVDNLEVAQFIYLLLNNERIRHVIDTITSKAILILGRFGERKPILDAIRDELRNHDLLPILFDFEKPTDRDFTETILTLAGMARFVIADLTDQASVPQELYAIIPHFGCVPIVPLIQSGKPYAMFHDFLAKDSVLPILEYNAKDKLIDAFQPAILHRANVLRARLLEKREHAQSSKKQLTIDELPAD